MHNELLYENLMNEKERIEAISNIYGSFFENASESKFRTEKELAAWIDHIAKAFEGKYCHEKFSELSVLIIKFIVNIELVLKGGIFEETKGDCRLALAEVINDVISDLVKKHSFQLKKKIWNFERIKCLINRMDDHNQKMKNISVPTTLGYDPVPENFAVYSYFWEERGESFLYQAVGVMIDGQMKYLIKFKQLEEMLQRVSEKELNKWRIFFNKFQQYYVEKDRFLSGVPDLLHRLTTMGISVNEILNCNVGLYNLRIIFESPVEKVVALIKKGFTAEDLLSHSLPSKTLKILIEDYDKITRLVEQRGVIVKELLDLSSEDLEVAIRAFDMPAENDKLNSNYTDSVKRFLKKNYIFISIGVAVTSFIIYLCNSDNNKILCGINAVKNSLADIKPLDKVCGLFRDIRKERSR